MNNKEVAHLWANQSRSQAKGSSFYFEGDTIYSYGSHFPIARHYRGCVLFTTRTYSNSTARHMSITRGACSHLTVFRVATPLSRPGAEHVKQYGERVKAESLSAARARNPDFALKQLQRTVSEGNAFCERFGFKTRFTMPDNLEELRARAKASAERERKARARDALEKIQQWLNGESVSIPYSVSKTYLRARAENMETSRGASVPLPEARKAYRFAVCMRLKGWRSNGEQFQVGDYHLDAVNEQGIVAGCHRLTWDEIERFASVMGWTQREPSDLGGSMAMRLAIGKEEV